MSSLLRSFDNLSFLFFFLVGIFWVANPLRAEVPPLPRPHAHNSQLNALGSLVSGSGVTHPQAPTTGTPIQTARYEEQVSEHLTPPNLIRQATFTTRPLSAASTMSDESYDERPEVICVEENERRVQEAVDAYNVMLDRSLSSNRLPRDFGDDYEDEESSGGWLSGIAKPTITPLLSIGGSLCIVLGAFFLLAILLRKVSPQGNRPLPKEAFECLGRYFLTQKHQVQVLRLGNRIVLVSVMPDGVSTLAEITDPDETVAFLGLCRRLDANSASEVFRKTVASMSGEELHRPYNRPVVSRQREQRAASLDLYSDPDESLASMLSRGRGYRG